MALFKTFQKRQIGFVLLGLLLLIGAFWIYPSGASAEWGNNQWKRSFTGTTWTFARHDGTIITDQLTLGLWGKIKGYSHPNESRWTVRGRQLVILSKTGSISSRFPLEGHASGLPVTLEQEQGGMHVLRLTKERHGSLLLLSALCAGLGILCVVAATPFAPAIRRRAALWGSKMSSIFNGRQWAMGILFAWLFLACAIAMTRAYVPDEAWFLYEALNSGKRASSDGQWVREVLFHSNAFGYGGLWWSLYTGLALVWHGLTGMYALPGAIDMLAGSPDSGKIELWEHATEMLAAPMFMMRILVLSTLAAVGVVVARRARSGAAALLATLVLVTMPLAWWSGKMASPELMGAALFALAVSQWFTAGRAYSALVLASIAVAVKLTIAPVYIVFVAFVAWDLWKHPDIGLRRLAGYIATCVLIVLLCNTWLFYDPKAGIDQLISLSKNYHPVSQLGMQSHLVLRSHSEFWEGSNYGSLSYWSGGLALVIISLAVAFCTQRRFAGFLLAGGILQYLFMMSQPPHGWYWFPVILSLIIPFSQLTPKNAALVGVLLLVCLAPFDQVRREVSYKLLHLQELKDVMVTQDCVQEKLKGYGARTVYDMAALGRVASRATGADWEALNYHDSYVTFMGGRPLVKGEKGVLLLGARSAEQFEQLRAISAVPGALIGQCGSLKLVKVGD